MNPYTSSNILLVIHEKKTRQVISDLLTAARIGFSVAEDGEDGIIMAHQASPDLILLDDNLPGMDFKEVCRILRSFWHLAEVPIVLLVERDSRESMASGLSTGVNDFIFKPVDGLVCQARIQSLLHLNRYRQFTADQARYKWLFEHAHEGYLVVDAKGKIRYANDAAQVFLNLPEEYVDFNLPDMVEDQYQPQPESVWANWLSEPEPCYLMRPESEVSNAIWLVMEALDTPPGIEHHRLVRIRNVTEQMFIYQDMRKFHTTVAHKLRTPVSLMASSLSILKMQLKVAQPDDIRSLVETAMGGAERLVREVRDVLTYVDAPLALNLGSPIKLGELPALVAQTAQALGLKQVAVNVPDYLASLSLQLTAPAMELIVEELLENAKKFHPEHAPRVDISAGQTESGLVRLRFADDGITLSAEQLSWAWLPYFQGEKDFTGELPGMGLGIPLVATLAWQSGGRLWVSNRPGGNGVLVELAIPIKEKLSELAESLM